MTNLIMLDVDGVLTDGRKVYDNQGLPIFKSFFDKDFTALKELAASDYEIIWVSGDDFVNKALAANRNYKFVSARGKCKGSLAKELVLQKCYSKVISVGDDVFDLPMAQYSDVFYYPRNASWRIAKEARNYPNCKFIELECNGGEGVIPAIAKLELFNSSFESIKESIEKLDRLEKF